MLSRIKNALSLKIQPIKTATGGGPSGEKPQANTPHLKVVPKDAGEQPNNEDKADKKDQELQTEAQSKSSASDLPPSATLATVKEFFKVNSERISRWSGRSAYQKSTIKPDKTGSKKKRGNLLDHEAE